MSTSSSTATVQRKTRNIPFILRVIWFFLLGWELTGVWILIAWALNISLIGLPLGLWMIDRVPQVLTLRARSGSYLIDLKDGHTKYISSRQMPFLVRAGYFILIGWWLSLIWAGAAWILCATILGLPLGVPMLNSLPMITTLHRN
jgi:uncharacterized membrane protein YccF (DUF307 family)